MGGQRHGTPPAASVGLHQVELELERDLRFEVHRTPGVDRLPQHVPGIERARLAVEARVADADQRVGLPRVAERVTVEVHVDVGQPHVELRVRHRQDLAVVGEGVHTDAEGRVTRGRHVAEQVLAALQSVDVGEEQPQALAVGFHEPARYAFGAAGAKEARFP